jgi:hypothetical protein
MSGTRARISAAKPVNEAIRFLFELALLPLWPIPPVRLAPQ